jgi:dipeptidyl aminopeptidase/acylaminoacyl peptidase
MTTNMSPHITRTSLCLGCLVSIAYLISGCGYRPAKPPSDSDVSTVASEIMSVGELYRSPEPSVSGQKIAYMQSDEKGRAMFTLDMASRRSTKVPDRYEIVRLYGWSPDDRYLLFKDLHNKKEWLNVHDFVRNTNALAAKDQSTRVDQAIWASSNELAFISMDAGEAELRLGPLGSNGSALESFDSPGTMDYLLPMSSRSLAWIKEREIWSIDLTTSNRTQLTSGASPQYLWLTYCQSNKEFLYCSKDASDWRHLYRLKADDGNSPRPVQLTFGDEQTYNGQWIENGDGYAFVGNRSNNFYLAIRTRDTRQNTNLFWSGNVIGYRVLNQGEKIYAAASLGPEPPGIWEYDVKNCALSSIVPGTNAPFHLSAIISQKSAFTPSFDGLRIPYYIIPPRGLTEGIKYPAVIGIPPEGGQFMRAWEKYPQFIANIGAFHIGVNPRGSDGYGTSYKRNHREDSHKDVYAVYNEIIKSPQIDRKRIFLMAYSNASEDANLLARTYPDLWAGVIIISGAMPEYPFTSRKNPNYLIFMGEQDSPRMLKHARDFEKWSKTNTFKATFVYDKNTAHHISDIEVDKRLGKEIAKFIYN